MDAGDVVVGMVKRTSIAQKAMTLVDAERAAAGGMHHAMLREVTSDAIDASNGVGNLLKVLAHTDDLSPGNVTDIRAAQEHLDEAARLLRNIRNGQRVVKAKDAGGKMWGALKNVGERVGHATGAVGSTTKSTDDAAAATSKVVDESATAARTADEVTEAAAPVTDDVAEDAAAAADDGAAATTEAAGSAVVDPIKGIIERAGKTGRSAAGSPLGRGLGSTMDALRRASTGQG